MSGLRANQAALSIISSNVSNAQTPGYVAQNPNQIEVASGDFGATVTTTGVNRQLHLFATTHCRPGAGSAAARRARRGVTDPQRDAVTGRPPGRAPDTPHRLAAYQATFPSV